MFSSGRGCSHGINFDVRRVSTYRRPTGGLAYFVTHLHVFIALYRFIQRGSEEWLQILISSAHLNSSNLHALGLSSDAWLRLLEVTRP